MIGWKRLHAGIIGLSLSVLMGSQAFASRQACTGSEIMSGPLAGTHQDAGSGAPVVLIVPGSGPTDRDGNSPQGLNTDTYKLLAEALCARQISTVRVDKRGMFGSAGAGDPNAVSVELYAEDYRRWIDTLRAETGETCLYLLGHSEGALMVSAAAIGREDVCGLILVAGMGRPFGDVLRTQLESNPANGPILGQAFEAIEQLESGQAVDVTALHPALGGLFAEPVQGFLISLMSINPAELAAKADTPTLVIQGGRDLQISLDDAHLIANATGGELITLPTVNHILKEVPENQAANYASYSNPDLPVSEDVVLAIHAFITADRGE